jgi:hypothetical protein
LSLISNTLTGTFTLARVDYMWDARILARIFTQA